jgi:RNA polymerase sigma-70 factor (ECF subfamily)
MTEFSKDDNGKRQFEAELSPILGTAYGVAFNMTHNREEAEDLVQETAIQAFRAFASFQAGTNFKAWFFRIMLNMHRNNYRKRQRQPEIAPLEDVPDLYLYNQSASSRELERTEDPGKQVISRMSEAQIGDALAALPDEFREVCALYFMDELQYQEIADILDCPVGTVRSRLHRGRKLLQKALWEIAREQGVVSGKG